MSEHQWQTVNSDKLDSELSSAASFFWWGEPNNREIIFLDCQWQKKLYAYLKKTLLGFKRRHFSCSGIPQFSGASQILYHKRCPRNMPATLCSKFLHAALQGHATHENGHKALLYPELFIKIILICWRLLSVLPSFPCWSSQALKQDFLLFHNMLWLLRWLHFMLAHGINLQNHQLSCHCSTTDFLIDVQCLRWLCSPGFQLVIRL